jgi:zinc/manganese transport system substrate-binding protein
MPKSIKLLLLCLLALAGSPAGAALNVLATTPEWGALAKEIGGDKLSIYVATNALQDVHHVEAKPSLIARARSADLLIATGAELEVGWLPVLQRESGNAKIQSGARGYFEAAQQVKLLEIPSAVDRSMGDVHPAGNPHIHLDPHNIARVAEAIAKRLAEIDTTNQATYESRLKAFQERWQQAITKWEAQGAALKGIPILVAHKDFTYLNNWLGMREVGALEPKPGVPPSTGHLTDLLQKLQQQPAKLILHAAYADPKAANWMAERTKIPSATLPYTVGGDAEAKDLFGLFDDTLARLTAAVK